jgi:predicted acyl esterase
LSAIEWIAAQPWCDGAVGMIGKSWGGFAALQAAAAAPTALRAVIVVGAADDRWNLDAHFMGGCLLVENFIWGAACMVLAAQPAGPIADPGVRREWDRRLDALQLLPARWMRHATRDDYWRQGSVNADWSRIRCPVFAVSGWADAYADAVPRLLAGLAGVRRGLVGPWAHQYPHESTLHPAIGFLQEAKAWWDRHLRGSGGGNALSPGEPMYRVWMQEHPRAGAGPAPPDAAAAPTPHPASRGRWIAEEAWPSPRIAMRELALVCSGAGTHRSEATIGGAAPPWCAFGFEVEPFPDQTPDDARSFVAESSPLGTRLEILGAAVVDLDLAADCPAAQLAVRLCDVTPDGDAVRVAYTLVDLGMRDDDTRRIALEPGERRRVRIPLRHAAHSFAPGHRVRVAVSTAYWPIVWPLPYPVTLHIHACRLELPVRPPDPRDARLRDFAPPECAAADPVVDSSPSTIVTREETVPETGCHVVTTCIDVDAAGKPARWLFTATGFEAGHASTEVMRIAPGDPARAEVELHHHVVQRWASDETQVELHLRARNETGAIRVEATLQANANGERVRVREWHERVEQPQPE